MRETFTMFKTALAHENWEKNYRYQNETPIETQQRLARALANVEKENQDSWYDKFLNVLVKFSENNEPIGLKCMPGGRITANAGTSFKKATMMNCFVSGPVSNATIKYERHSDDGSIKIPIEQKTDENPDDLANIFLTILEQAKTLAAEGGYGINFDFIRPRGSIIKGTGIKHPGVVSYMEIWDAVSECIVKGNDDGYVDRIKNYLTEEQFNDIKDIIKNKIRKGACMGVLNVSHPDAEEFIKAKQVPGKLTKFNMSIAIDDAFMNAVINDDFYEQSFKGKVYKKIKARDLYNLIMESTYNRNEPGVLFIDNMHKNNPLAYLGKANATNPCIIGSSILAVADVRYGISIKQLAEEGKVVHVHSVNNRTGQIEIKLGMNPRKTGEKVEVWKLTLDDDSIFIATPDHLVCLQNGKEKELKNLKTKDKIAPYGHRPKSVEFYGYEDVYNITVDGNHNYIVLTSYDDRFLKSSRICVKNCGEVPGLSSITSVCLLGSINVTQYITIENGKAVFDYGQYCDDIKIFTRMLDNVNDITVNPLQSYTWVAKNIRQIGMGLNGLGSALLMLGIPYNSKEALDFVKKVCQLKENLTWQASALLAKEKGTFLAYNKEKFTSTEYFNSDRITEETKDLIRKYGVRNGKTTTNPPLGNGSIAADNVSNGIEPIFELEYQRKAICEWPEGLNTENVKEILKYHKRKDYEYWYGKYNDETYYYEPHNRGLCKESTVRDYGYQWYLDNKEKLTIDKEDFLITTKKLGIEDHLNVQEIVQYYNNQSVSKTCNLPAAFKFDDFKSLYIKAWKKGLNGFTTYREGTMESVLSCENRFEVPVGIIKKDIKLPAEFINGNTTITKREGIKFYINFSYLPEDTFMQFPVCMWIHTNSKEKGVLTVCNRAARELEKLALKSGIDRGIVQETVEKVKVEYEHNRLSRMISLCLRHNVPREDILITLTGIEGDSISTLLTAVRKFIGKTIRDGTKLTGIICPECKGTNVVMESGCRVCKDCACALCG
jgi:ribonucleotide reductase alpha subunit